MPGRGAAPQARHLAHLETRVVGQLLVALQRRRLLAFGCGQRPTLTRTHQGGSGDGKRDAPSAWPLGRRTWRSGGYTTLLFTCASKQVRAEWGRRRPTRLALLGSAATPSCPCRPGRTPAAGPPQCPATHRASPGARGCQVGVTASSWQPRTHRDVQPLAQDFPGAGDHLELDHGQRAPPESRSTAAFGKRAVENPCVQRPSRSTCTRILTGVLVAPWPPIPAIWSR